MAFLGKIGNDQAGKNVISEMEELGIDTSNHLVSGNHCTGYSVIINSFEGDRTVLTYRGANANLGEKELPWGIIKNTRWVYLTSLRGLSVTIIARLFDECKKHNVKIAWNPGSQQVDDFKFVSE